MIYCSICFNYDIISLLSDLEHLPSTSGGFRDLPKHSPGFSKLSSSTHAQIAFRVTNMKSTYDAVEAMGLFQGLSPGSLESKFIFRYALLFINVLHMRPYLLYNTMPNNPTI